LVQRFGHEWELFWPPGLQAPYQEDDDAEQADVPLDRHGSDSRYLFVDGHVEHLRREETFGPAAKRNLWNPALAE